MKAVRIPLAQSVLAVLIGTLAAPCTSLAASITSYNWNDEVKLELIDGRRVEGRYRGVFGRSGDPSTYAARYAKWQGKHASAAAPSLGDPLVVTRNSGEPIRGTFRGFADKALLLATEDSSICVVLPLDQVAEVRRANGTASDAAVHRHWKSAPSVFAVALDVQGERVAVPATLVVDRSMLPHAGGSHTGTVVAAVVLTTVLVAGAALAMAASAFSQSML